MKPEEQATSILLQTKAVLVHMSIKTLGLSRKDASATALVAEHKRAAHGAGHYQKKLLDKTATKELRYLANEARAIHRENTLPWLDSGYRMLPTKNHDKYTKEIADVRRRFDAATLKLAGQWTQIVNQQRARLGELFDEADYKTAEQVRCEFQINVDMIPLPSQRDFRVNLNEAEVARMKVEFEEKQAERLKEAVGDIYERLEEALGRISERLEGDDKKVFRDSLIGNVVKIAEVLPALNVSEDPELDKIHNALKDKVAGVEPDEVRKDHETRKTVKTAADDILAKVQKYRKRVEGAK